MASSAPFSFDFGPTTTVFSAGGRPMAEMQRRVEFLTTLVQDTRKRELAAKARAAAAKADYNALWGAFHYAASVYTCSPNKLLRMAGIEVEYDDLVRMEQQVGELEKRVAELTKENKQLSHDLSATKEEASTKEASLTTTTAEVEKLREQLYNVQEDFELEKKSNEASDALLTAAYADHEATKALLNKVKDERDAHELAHTDARLKLDSINKEYAELQEKLAEHEQTEQNLIALQKTVEELSEEVNDYSNAMQDREHILQVKDARIANLEDELQKALKISRVAEATVEAVKSPTSEPMVLSGGESLEAELGGLEEEEDEEEEEWEPQHLEFVGVIESASISIAPVEPVELETKEQETMTEAEPKPETKDTETNTEISEKMEVETMTDSALNDEKATMTDNTTTTETKPEKQKQHLTLSNIFTTAFIEPVSAIIPKTAEVFIPKSTTFMATNHQWIITLLVLLCSVLYSQLLSRNEALSACYGYGRGGAYGSAGYLLGVLPIGFDVGSSALSEMFGRWVAMMLFGVEEWLGVERISAH